MIPISRLLCQISRAWESLIRVLHEDILKILPALFCCLVPEESFPGDCIDELLEELVFTFLKVVRPLRRKQTLLLKNYKVELRLASKEVQYKA